MRIAVVHYHFKPGGVTRIVESAAEALVAHDVEMVAISGEPYEGKADMKAAVVPGLAYTTDESEYVDPKFLLHEIKSAAADALGGAPDLWHIHNHSLGKNSSMPDVVAQLAKDAPVLLQIHDFAEDGRPANYELIDAGISDWKCLYPLAPQVHYAVLNQRDYGFLKTAGIPEETLHLLPNPVSLPSIQDIEPQKVLGADRLIVYPTRAIRRKNVGEFLFWSALAQEGDLFAATLAPANPTARPVYERWVAFAEQQKLRAKFELAGAVDLSFPEVMASAEAIITTSVAEGFGMAFLEPFLFGKGLLGRDLPDITGDFSQSGVGLDGLYERLDVPLEWIGGEGELRVRLSEALTKAYAAYGRACKEETVQAALDAAVREGRVDFGRLDEELQERVILQLLATDEPRKEIQPWDLMSQGAAAIEANCEAIAEHFNLEQYGRRLMDIYSPLCAVTPAPLDALDAARVLDAFLDPARFCLLRT